MTQIPVHNIQGEVVDQIDLKDEVFKITPNLAVVHQAMVRQLANARQGTACTKTRAQVSGGGRKPFRQKGTGRARRGSSTSPLLKGGGIAFGPHPRSYRQEMPKKMRHLALRSVLSAKLDDGELMVVNQFELPKPSTKDMARILAALGMNTSALIVTSNPDPNIYKSARNLERIEVTTANILNIGDLLSHKMLVLTVEAVGGLEDRIMPKPKELAKI